MGFLGLSEEFLELCPDFFWDKKQEPGNRNRPAQSQIGGEQANRLGSYPAAGFFGLDDFRFPVPRP